MTSDHDIGGAVARLDRLFEDRLRLKRGDFDARAKRARGMLPRRLRRDLAALLEARKVAGHPKLARMLDGASLHAASSRLEAYIKSVDIADRRRGRLLLLLSGIMLNLLIIFALVMAVLLWRGLV